MSWPPFGKPRFAWPAAYRDPVAVTAVLRELRVTRVVRGAGVELDPQAISASPATTATTPNRTARPVDVRVRRERAPTVTTT